MTEDSRPVDQRRFALLVYIRRSKPTMDQIIAMPAYQGINPDHVRRYAERDLQGLRESGYHINVDDNGRYLLDDSGNIHVDCTGVELGILRSLLGSKAKSSALAYAQQGVTKLLSSGMVTTSATNLTVHTPRGEEVVSIAAAIQLGRRIQFSYRGTRAAAPELYTVEPFRLEVHLGAFYLRGYQIHVEGRSSRGNRMYKLDRLHGKVKILDSALSHAFDETEETLLSPVTARVWLSRELPLIWQASDVQRCEDGYVIELRDIDRGQLYSDLMFYGLDAKLIGPKNVCREFENRLRHLAQLGEERRG
ncbi:proteasome accessory factor B [Trueperella bonasi]|uniref:Proteasome accessory factor B n=1 Tax=Trueperella bonasi TaxID=312286 RepID=A0ABT9NDJ5_9ACTO|nr:WYL domain-containing protein [Trueperella bonasi]MDP9805459.1 proteasome accessory factor B [Trueperella bonasi]